MDPPTLVQPATCMRLHGYNTINYTLDLMTYATQQL